eukprot:1194160-Prorocentrum_minimum.AAC.1
MSFDTVSPTPMCLPQSSHKRVGFHSQDWTWFLHQHEVHLKTRRLEKSSTLAFLLCGFRLLFATMTLIRGARLLFAAGLGYTRWLPKGYAKNPGSHVFSK